MLSLLNNFALMSGQQLNFEEITKNSKEKKNTRYSIKSDKKKITSSQT